MCYYKELDSIIHTNYTAQIIQLCVSFPDFNQNPTESDIPDDYNSIPGCLKQIFSKYHFDKFEIDFVILVKKRNKENA